jgi:hypothetical protein
MDERTRGKSRKNRNRLRKLTSKRNVSREALLKAIIELADTRATMQLPTLFIVNCGCSGSHWIAGMLSDLPRMNACGEVEFSEPLLPWLTETSEHARIAFIDAVHQVHTRGKLTVDVDDILDQCAA